MKNFQMGAKLYIQSHDTKKEEKNVINYKIESKNNHQLIFHYEKRKGKDVTLIGRFYISLEDKKDLLKLLKKKLACGGSIDEEFIQLQGKIKDKSKTILLKEGWKFK